MSFTNAGPSITVGNQTSLGFTNNVFDVWVGLNITPAAVASNTTAEQMFTIANLNPGDIVTAFKPTVQAGLAVVAARVTAQNTIGITYENVTGAPITPTAGETYTVNVTRLLPQYIGNLPTALPLI